MMISPGTPRIQRSKGTMSASFAGHCGVTLVTGMGAPGPGRMKSGSRKGSARITASVVTAKAAHLRRRLHGMQGRSE